MKIVELAPRGVDAIDGDRRLGVLEPVRDAARVGQEEAIDFEDHQAPAPRLLDDMRLEAIVECDLLHLQAELLLQVLERKLLEGEVVAFEILRDGEAEGGGRVLVHRIEDLDPHVDVAIGLRPVARAVVQWMRHIAVGRDGGKDGDRRRCQHACLSPRAHRGRRAATDRRRARDA